MTNRRELADRLEARAVSPKSAQYMSDLTEAARLLREPVAGEVESDRERELDAHLHAIRSIEASCPQCADTRRTCANTIAEMEVAYRARLGAEGKG